MPMANWQWAMHTEEIEYQQKFFFYTQFCYSLENKECLFVAE